MNRNSYYTENAFILLYFIPLILIGAGLLRLPVSWSGPGRLSFIEALFTATSAVCVTGLIVVDTAAFTVFGRVVILILIQAGGLGIITFTTFFLALPIGKLPLSRRTTISGFYLSNVEFDPVRIVRQIVLMTLTIELLGAALLAVGFRRAAGGQALFYGLFHSVSAFCNAGFSLFSDNLEAFRDDGLINLTVAGLVILGGLGFVVLRDLLQKALGTEKNLVLHTRIVVFMTVVLLVLSMGLYLLFEYQNSLRGLPPRIKILAAFFQAVMPRTAGFDTIAQSELTLPSKLITMPLMFVGGAPGSISGGIKVTTLFVVLLVALQGADSRGELQSFRRKIRPDVIFRATTFLVQALLILFLCVFLLTVTEVFLRPGEVGDLHFLALVFESFSALGTVGLSLGITASLSTAGKFVIVLAMFTGRIGLVLLAIPHLRRYPTTLLDYPAGEVLIG